MKENTWVKTAKWLLIAGGINWGLSVFNVNLVDMIANAVKLPVVATIVYAAVGISAIIYAAKN